MLMNRKLRTIFLAAVLTLVSIGAFGARNWELMKSAPKTESKLVIKESEIEVRTGRGVIIVTTSHPVQIKVFSILGQVISQETLPVGTSQLQIGSHGVFIVKVGDLTCKVAL